MGVNTQKCYFLSFVMPSIFQSFLILQIATFEPKLVFEVFIFSLKQFKKLGKIQTLKNDD